MNSTKLKVIIKWAFILSSSVVRITPYGWDLMQKQIEEAESETNKHGNKQPVCITKPFHSTKLRR